MAKNLRKFETEAQYQSATLEYPSVSWVVSGDTLHYDKEKVINLNDIMISFNNNVGSFEDVQLWDSEYSPFTALTSMTVSSSGGTTEVSNPSTTYVHRLGEEGGVITLTYGTNDGYTCIDEDYFGVPIGAGFDMPEYMPKCDMYVPSKIEHVYEMPTNCKNLVINVNASTVYEVPLIQSYPPCEKIYVPDASVSLYEEKYHDEYRINIPILGISEYNGILPIN